MLVHPRAFQVCPQASQVCPQVTQVHPRARMLLVLLTPTWILQTCPRVGQVGVMLQTYTQVLWFRTRVLQARPQVLQAFLRVREIIRYSFMLLYVMRIMNRCIINLIFIKMLCCVNHQSKFFYLRLNMLCATYVNFVLMLENLLFVIV
jgi:hypothetical protein